jgi:hypothetical protein
VQLAAVALDERAPTANADDPAEQRAGEVADRAGDRQHQIALQPRGQRHAEDDRLLPGDGACRQDARVEHDQLAARRQQRVDGHEHEDGVHAVLGDRRGQLAGHRGRRDP